MKWSPVTATDTWTASDGGRIAIVVRRNRADKVYRAVAYGAGGGTLLLMGLIGTFLLVKAWPALHSIGWAFFTHSDWLPEAGHFGITGVLVGTILIALVALVFAVPVATLAALFITEYAPRRLARPITSLIDVLAAVPSLIYGLWGRYVPATPPDPPEPWLADHLGFIPIFNSQGRAGFSSSTFIAGTVVALMIVPICTAVMREVFSQAPRARRKGALALGRHEVGRDPRRRDPVRQGRDDRRRDARSRPGARRDDRGHAHHLARSIHPGKLVHILPTGGNSIASLIALKFGESSGTAISALMAAGLVLFVMTLVVNAIASTIVARSRSGSATEI